MDDSELLRDFAETRSERAFALLVERHAGLVYSAALRRTQGDPHRATEVTQMVFIDLARKAAQLSRHPLLIGWLHRSTCWAAANLYRAERRRQLHERAAADLTAEVTAVEEAADWAAVRPFLDEALDQLRDMDREAVLLRFFANHTFAEVARRLETSENAARMRVDRALEKLHDILRRRGATTGAAAIGLALSQHAVSAAPVDLAASLLPASLTAAGAAGAGGGGALVYLLMNKLSYSLLAAVAVGLGVGLWWEQEAGAAEIGVIAQLRQQQAVRRTEIDRVSEQVKDRQQALASLPSVAGQPPVDPVELERKRLDLIVRRGELDAPYAAVFRRLQLEPAALDAFKTLLVERAQAIYDAQQLAKAEGVQLATYAETQELERAAARPSDRQIAALLGADKFGQFQRSLTAFGYIPVSEASDPARWQRAEALHDLYEQVCADVREAAYANNSYGGPLPDVFVQRAQALMTPDEYARLLADQETLRATQRMEEIARTAASQGKLKLSKGSARDYAVPTPAAAQKP